MKEGDLKVWWIPQVPMKSFYVPVETPQEAKKLLKTLAEYDLFQHKNKVKSDYCNAGGLLVYEDDEWSEWYDEETGDDIDSWEY